MMAPVNPRHPLCRHAPEWWPGLGRNAGPACSGTGGRYGPESATHHSTEGDRPWPDDDTRIAH